MSAVVRALEAASVVQPAPPVGRLVKAAPEPVEAAQGPSGGSPGAPAGRPGVTPAELENWQLRAALAHGIPADHAQRLTGGSPAEVMADAESFARTIREARGPVLRTRPTPVMGGGSNLPVGEFSAARFAAAILKRRYGA
ncbi:MULTISPECIES: hypothetical protein [Kitasatospora]|uniref:Uncharacterized protein n=1 Tax=Kitasatospora setae (strain ATCC 33774 / DSM 43861 / JCM 3304 / KCC A-0304 / NBRC 14216 / KM-6054) TaxID=452652 RepID=E4N8X7_KITSK|nr:MULTISPECIES: hypothetical protein [Kitasatospora]BAJ27658.1 hypothetical protein KSE_18330 [Kitasatospora setae KM-6054]